MYNSSKNVDRAAISGLSLYLLHNSCVLLYKKVQFLPKAWRPLKCFDSSHRRGGESQQERRALSQEARSPPSPRALCRSKAGCSPREGAASCGSRAGRRNLVPRSQVVPVLFLTKQLVRVVSGVAPRLLPVHAHLFQSRHNRLYNMVLQKKWSKIICRNFLKIFYQSTSLSDLDSLPCLLNLIL